MKIEIMGAGCVKCRKTEELIKRVVKDTGIKAEVLHITDLNEIISRDVMMTPAVFIDGEKKIEGRIPTEIQVKTWLKKPS